MSTMTGDTTQTLISFFRGVTFDGVPYVLSIEGGDVAGDPGYASGVVGSMRRRVLGLTAKQGLWLHHNLPLYEAHHTFKLTCLAKRV